MTSRIAFIDEALVLNGSEPLGSETAPGAETHLAAFKSAKNLILCCHPWSFCTFTRQLVRITQPPELHWKYSYELPPDMIGGARAFFDRSDFRSPFTNLELFGEREVRTDADRLWLSFTKDVPIAVWSAAVREVILLLLRSELALSIREDRSLRNDLRVQAIGTDAQMLQGGLLAAARGINDMGRPSQAAAAAGNPIIDVRRSGAG